jgi:hypothetical protein
VPDHHSEYLARAVAVLTPEGHRRVDELLDQLAGLVDDRSWLVAFAKARRAEADSGKLVTAAAEPAEMLSADELDRLISGFEQVRDQEPLDDVGDWANAVAQLLEDAAERN